MIKVLFICHGNICRSPMAEFVLKDLVKKEKLEREFFIDSAATSREEIGNNIHIGTLKKLESVGIFEATHKAKQITKDDYKNFDYLIGMDEYNVYNIKRFLNIDVEVKDKKIYKLLDFTREKRDIKDPWYTGDFDATYNDVLQGTKAFLEFVKTKKNS